MPWTGERVEQLKRQWADGLSAADIASLLGGTTRNAVIGKAHRLGLTRPIRGCRPACRTHRAAWAEARALRPAAPKAKPPTRSVRTGVPVGLPKAPLPLPVTADVVGVRHEDLEPHHCRYPIGDPQDPGFGFCGAAKVLGHSYCPTHLARCTTAIVTPRRPAGWIASATLYGSMTRDAAAAERVAEIVGI